MDDKKNEDVEAIAEWLATETGHTGETETEEEGPKQHLPTQRRENMRQFFDGIDLEKKMTERRRNKAMEPIEQADELMKAVQQPPTSY